jgi:hypothetical protein
VLTGCCCRDRLLPDWSPPRCCCFLRLSEAIPRFGVTAAAAVAAAPLAVAFEPGRLIVALAPPPPPVVVKLLAVSRLLCSCCCCCPRCVNREERCKRSTLRKPPPLPPPPLPLTRPLGEGGCGGAPSASVVSVPAGFGRTGVGESSAGGGRSASCFTFTPTHAPCSGPNHIPCTTTNGSVAPVFLGKRIDAAVGSQANILSGYDAVAINRSKLTQNGPKIPSTMNLGLF